MQMQQYQMDDELRVARQPDGSEQVGIRRTVSAPSDALKGHIEAVRDYEEFLNELEERFKGKVESHRTEINEKLSHTRFFNKEFKGNEWGHNREFDMLRRDNLKLADTLERELRTLDMKEIDTLKSFAKERRDARSEVSPFRKFI